MLLIINNRQFTLTSVNHLTVIDTDIMITKCRYLHLSQKAVSWFAYTLRYIATLYGIFCTLLLLCRNLSHMRMLRPVVYSLDTDIVITRVEMFVQVL